LHIQQKIFVWHGIGSSQYCRQAAEALSQKISTEIKTTIIEEGTEPAQFWKILGGKDSYCDRPIPFDRLKIFNCTNQTKNFKCDRLFSFNLDILTPRGMLIIDVFDQVYLWFGSESNVQDRKLAVEIAKEYIDNAPDNRTKSDPVIINEGSEPVHVSSIFHGYSRFSENKGEIVDSNEYLEEFDTIYTYEQLLDRKSLPETVDRTKLETYLSPEEFLKVFGVAKDKFESQPKWKKEQQRKAKKLF